MNARYSLVRTMYRTGRITAAQVWEYVDKNVITEDEAIRICGPRPE